MQIKQEDFLRLTDFVKKQYGINLAQKKHLIESRLGTVIKGMGLTDFKQYVDRILKTKDEEDLNMLINRLTTNHTYFMRENEHFEFLKNTILPELERTCVSRNLGVWSAACSSGEEPYTLSMILLDHFGAKQPKWDTRILATDISHRVLQLAQQGTYNEEDMKDVPEKWKRTYFDKKGRNYEAKPALKNNVIFREFNLMDPIRFKMPFDIIFCRNVMIYFEQATKDALFRRFANALKPGGYLIIGLSETMNQANSQLNLPFQYVMPSVYKRK